MRTNERDRFKQYLLDNGIETVIHYPVAPHKQQAYADWKEANYPVSEEIHKTVLSLPLHPAMAEEEIKAVIAACNAYV